MMDTRIVHDDIRRRRRRRITALLSVILHLSIGPGTAQHTCIGPD